MKPMNFSAKMLSGSHPVTGNGVIHSHCKANLDESSNMSPITPFLDACLPLRSVGPNWNVI